MRKVLQVTENNHEWKLEDDSSHYEENKEFLGDNLRRSKRSPIFFETSPYLYFNSTVDYGWPMAKIFTLGTML